ncbi:zinc finger protein 883-like [Cydia strobilella]|uniref:zinc finger protein 883-like n=1 Tax=Cydia strobilella TaxID=1100964 RepID=UPI003006A16B
MDYGEHGDYINGIVKEEKMQVVKEEPVFDDTADTSEAALAGLYAAHVVKDELVPGPKRPHRPDVGLVVRGIVKEEKKKMQVVKEEPVYGDSADTCETALAGLYAAHVVKDELVLGPERPHRPDVSLVVRGIVKKEVKLKDEEMQSVKVEPVCDDSADTREAALSGLYAAHVVKDELVPGPERPHRPDVGLVVRDWALGDADSCPLALDRGGAQVARVCSERLERCADATSHHVPSETASEQILAERASPRQKHTDTLQHETKYVCDCGEIFQQKHNLIEHIKLHHRMGSDSDKYERSGLTSKRQYVCDICKMTFTRLNNLKSHKGVHTGEKPYSCEICKKRFRQLSGVKKHKLIHSGEKSYQCDVCEKKFNQSCHLKIHKRTHTGEKPYQCEVCQKQFRDQSAATTHKLIHTGEKPYQCDVCEKKFSQLCNLKIHKRTHTGEKPYQCEVCQKQFRDMSAAKTHKLMHTGEKPYQCEVCEKKFTQPSRLQIHKLSHTGEKPYQCEVCQKQFRDSRTAKNHKLIHTGEKPYQCEVCERKFTKLCSLKSHKQSHTGEKPYQCEVCEKKFTRSDHLQSHKRVHTGEKPYQCEVCEKKFTQLGNLNSHKRSHTGEKY